MSTWLRWPGRAPFAMAFLVLLVVIGVRSDTIVHWIDPAWVEKLGFAPRDWLPPSTWRVLGSTIVTTGARAFWEAVFMIAVVVGASEWRTGTRTAAITFWGAQIVTLAVESAVLAGAAGLTASAATVAALSERTVGASIGFVACTGLVLSQLEGRRAHIVAAAIMVGLVALFFVPYPSASEAVKLSDDLGHLVAFPFGWLAGRVWAARKGATHEGARLG